MPVPALSEIEETFELLEDWQDRYGYIIELGDQLPPMQEEDKNTETFVPGCVSQVWIKVSCDAQQKLTFVADSDAHLVRGLIAIILSMFDGKTAPEILATPVENIFQRLDLESHITPNRRGGLQAMVHKIRTYAQSF